MKRINFVYIFLLCVSCEQNEIPIAQHPMGVSETIQINMGSNYSQQIFYSMKDNISLANNTKTDWDLAFSSSSNTSKIIINSSTFSQISELENHVFEDPVTLTELIWQWDSPKGIYNGTAFNSMQSSTTYILDRGYNIDGTARGYRKIRIDSINNTSYFITYAELDNTDLYNVEIKKDGLSNFQYFSFNDNIVIIEPDKEEWDLVFTQYTHLFPDNLETPAYLVTGVLTNYLNNVMVAKDTTNSFEQIGLDMINIYDFSNHQDEIGYNWKVFDFETQTYTVQTEITYIIKDVSNRYFKLHFIDFYDEYGEKGSPKFEVQEL
ncbi:MAG: hypothetical protein CMD19_04350 [Flavobacteriales bacterium]|jgi:hypothetical protein|nr:hypothetical protein [Flavobacteriales bacterium]|tara:strand:- start:16810 stop:17772 length:963 start_codon:yes stop_codon:yes gene_type:complete